MTPLPPARAIRPEEAESFLALMCRGFGMDPAIARGIFYADPFYDLSLKRVLADEAGELLSCLTLVPAAISLGGIISIPVCGVAGVCTEPALRGRGYAARLIGQTLSQLQAGSPFAAAALTAASPARYEKLGWAACADGVAATLPAGALPVRRGSRLQARLLTHAEAVARAAEMHALYDSHKVHRSSAAAFERDKRRWRCIEAAGGERRIMACFNERRITGCAAFFAQPLDSSPGAINITVQDMVVSEGDQIPDLLNSLAALPGCREVQAVLRPTDAQTLRERLPALTTRAAAPIYLRTVSLAKLAALACSAADTALMQQVPETQFAVCIDAADAEGDPAESIIIDAEHNRARVSRIDSRHPLAECPQLIGSRGSVTQLVFGYRSARELVEAHRLRLSGASGLNAADIVLPVCDAVFPKRELFAAPADLF